ncbi:MAG TPA: hypothetical protein VGA80_07180 [Flavobacteriaceae bacterium]
MKYLLILLMVFTTFFMACDGRTSKSESLKNAISEFNGNYHIQNNFVTYIPKEYTEIITDTIIENKVNIHIKNYTLMDENVINSFDDNIHKLEYQRSFGSEIVVYNLSGVWFKTHLNASTFPENNHNSFWNNATLQHAWVNQEDSSGDNVSILVSFVNPTTKSYRLYQLHIDKTGICNTTLKENFI